MITSLSWLKNHLATKANLNQVVERLTEIGLEVENIKSSNGNLDNFIICKIVKSQKHPNADRLKVCDVDIGKNETTKVVCGAVNAKKDLLTIYAPPGATIPKNQMKLTVSKIRGVTSYGMLCSEFELNLSDESEGITELPNDEYLNKIGMDNIHNHEKALTEPMKDRMAAAEPGQLPRSSAVSRRRSTLSPLLGGSSGTMRSASGSL